ncbi:M56 family metallopeptidase [Chitinophaga arvensicola]|uniref:BlaR1 peptidase M56 n=1 Tax=Chitinophaga arvensicola TaxID=29529 RepID=A0A1I0SAX5_9BACT|nr:M56 family metallopeptidase [Chitinophaga arvensicola]SEW53544.1 BlaR1 peptidase M56 [Chitinophaga arvensicola]
MNLLPITGDFVRALGWTILHSMWQAFFIYACLRIVFKLWPQAGARIKYNLSLLSLSGIFTWFLATLYMHVQRLQEARETAIQITGNNAIHEPIHITAVYPSQEPLIWLFPNLELCFPILVTLYITGMAAMTGKLLSDLFQLRKIRTTRIEPMGAAWEKHLDKLAAQLQIPRKVKLLISRHVQVPVMLGFLKPLILLPVAMVNNLSEAQLEAVLLHELAHIKRNDYLLNIFQSIVETILFFNPFIWLISKIIRMEREHCCDDLVIASTVQPLQYAHALVALEEYRLTANRLTMAAADSKQHLFHRIKRIMEMKTKHLNYSQKFLAVLIIATGLVSIAWLNPAKGKDNSTQQPAAITKKVTANSSNETKAAVATSPINSFYQQLDAIACDSTIPAPAAPPTPPEPPAPAPAPDPAPSPNQTPVAAPLAPLAPLQGDLSTDLSDIVVVDMSNVKADVKTNVQVNKNVNHQSSFSYQFQQPNKEEIIKQVKEAQKSMQLAMKQMKNVDVKKMQAEIAEATKNINWQELSEETRKAREESIKALNNIDWTQITNAQKEATEALNKIDFTALNNQLTSAAMGANSKAIYEKIRQDVKAGFQAADVSRQYAAASMDEVRKNRASALANAAKVRADAGRQREAVAKGKGMPLDTTGKSIEAAKRQKEAAERAAEGDRRAKEGAERAKDAERRQKEAAERGAERAKDMERRQKEAAERAAESEKRVKESIERAKESAERAKAAQTGYKEMISQMAAEKLLDANNYKLEKNDNGLFINGVKQPDNIAGKYSKYLQGKQITMTSNMETRRTEIKN